ncbi:L-threonylcarbamoyladenylate synthase [Paenibacillus chartarius]|uniref:Threonylcarbamoyl-AMP synthase n=1 Tax=Paenibacillus chartarius TaxID=747481 RepID=A0ABV6DUT1_9BACL
MMQTFTKFWTIPPGTLDMPASEQAVTEAALLLRQGGIVAFPTETVYGLGADATRTEAVGRVFEAKGRPSDNPLIVHIADPSQLAAFVDADAVGEAERRLMAAFWPGPLTVVLPVRPGALSPLVTAGLTTVGVRIPDHPLALALLRRANVPVAAPSANRSGKPSPTSAQHVADDLAGRIDGLLDGGTTGVGVESTVVRVDAGALHVLRPGGVTRQQLAAALPELPIRDATAADAEVPRAPGMKYAHYAPQGRLTVVQPAQPADRSAVRDYIRAQLRAAREAGERSGVLTFDEHVHDFAAEADVVLSYGPLGAPEQAAQRLYDALRAFDAAEAACILAEAVPEAGGGIGEAVMNRLRKAAGHRIVFV